ncbi:NAD(P)/FAD-dependent oxidoreductase [Actinomadura viridis]|uniref:NAD(P)/FAD-dependent oxidoreductase n=1 Tax=Actinomadura viridis TaxID=58110 RepID=UPI0036A5AC03
MSSRPDTGRRDGGGRAGGRAAGGQAVVLGAGLAGMFAAAALSRHMERVVVVERDRLPEGPEWRRGVPQSRHAHNLMTAGHTAMNRLLPGVRDELRDAGMVEVGMPRDMLLLTAGGWMPRFTTPLFMMTSSRDLIDWVVRDRLHADPKVEFLEETEAVGLLTEGPRHAEVRGVRVRGRDASREAGRGEPYEIEADFVVDATGRRSRTPEWLRAMGYETPAESVVDAQVAYSTCVFDPPPGHEADWNCVLLQSTPDAPRQGILNPIEGGRWMVSLAAMGGERPPLDHDGFLGYARTLRSPVLYDTLVKARPVGPVHGSGRTENRRRHYERLRRWPERFLVLGDGAGALNPSYGQGMSVAACSAVALDEALAAAGGPAGVASGMRKKVARCIDTAWAIAATGDLGYPWAINDAGLSTRMKLRYLYRVVGASAWSRPAARALLDLNQMVSSPAAVFRPRVVTAVLRGSRKVSDLPPALAERPPLTHAELP